ncbi:secretin N-terminal domain-containing protein [Pontiellaceae bacterium B1224]|nr:secretin N-terminal domain-containing protein [Pontiellaceae bacterium B1224]
MRSNKRVVMFLMGASLAVQLPITLAQDDQNQQGQRRRPGGSPPGAAVEESSQSVNSSNSNTGPNQLLNTSVTRDAAGSEVAINWENITLKDCIEVLCRDLGMEFIISPSVNVTQEVSIRAGNVTEWERADKLEMFDAILETAGVQRIERGRVWVFSPSDIRPIIKVGEDTDYPDGKPIIGVIELENIDASTAQTFLNNFTGKPQRIFGMENSNVLVALGTQAWLKQMQDLLSIVDVPSSVLVQHVLEKADATDVAEELSNLFYRRTGYDGSAVQFFAIARLNMVIAHNATPAMVPEIERWVEMLDRADGTNERVTKIYRLKVVEAETIGATLDDLYSSLYAQSQEKEQELGKTATKTNTRNSNTANNNNTGDKNASTPQPVANNAQNNTSSGGESPNVAVDEEVIILSDEETNTLIVNAPASMHKEIAKTIEELDRSRRQVLIETVLVEVTLDESLDLGIEWAVFGSDSSAAQLSGLDLNSFGPLAEPITTANSGFTYLLNANEKAMALIHAAQDDDRLQVLSSPTVLTRDGMEAEVSFGKEVPVEQSSISDSGTENFYYEYRDAKITLTVTPKIDDYRMVTLDLEQTVRALDADSSDADAPTFYTREIRSNLQVDDGQTLILGGLIERTDQKVRTGIPFLSQLPVVGWVFGRTRTAKVGSEILMIMTPHVVDTREETDLLTEEFRHKILGAMDEKDIRSLYDLQDDEPQTEKPNEEAVEESK